MLKPSTSWKLGYTAAVIIVTVILFLVLQFHLPTNRFHIKVLKSLNSNYFLNSTLLDHDDAPLISNLIFIKTYKTGSTLIGSILFRFGLRHRLKFNLLPNEDDHFMNASQPRCLDCNLTLYHDVGQSMASVESYRNFVPLGRFLTIVRDPVSRYFSDFYYHFYPVESNMTTRENATELLHWYIDEGRSLFSLERALAINDTRATNPKMNDMEVVSTKLAIFDIVLILERLDESLIMMKRLFGWKIKDVVSLPVNQGCGRFRPWNGHKVICPVGKESLNSTYRERLKKLLRMDQLIYDQSMQKLDALIAQQDPHEFQQDVLELRRLNQQLEQQCLNDQQENENEDHHQTNPTCLLYSIGDHPSGYEKLARDCQRSRFQLYGAPMFTCQLAMRALV